MLWLRCVLVGPAFCSKANVMPASMNQPRGCHGQECYQVGAISVTAVPPMQRNEAALE